MRFVIYKSSNGQFYYVVKGANGETMVTSETMVSKASCESAIASIKAGAATASVVDMS
jgi:uncharacterized protein YegP (UPF0339 family)